MNNLPSFNDLLNNAPEEIKELIEQSKTIKQPIQYHPEIFVYLHLIIVFKRAFETKDIDLILAAFFHDLGKMKCTKLHPTKTDVWTAYGHEFISCHLLKKYRSWVVQQGANFNNVYFIVENHMRMNSFDKMRKFKQDKLREHPCFEKLKLFSKIDDMLNDFKF